MEVVKEKELMDSIEVFVVFAMAALHLPVVSGSERFNAFVLNTKPIQCNFKERFLVGALSVEAIGKLRAVVRLDTFNGIREAFYAVLNEL